jgi:large subunit ribosomal protein L4
LTARLREDRLTVVDKIELEAPKTKAFLSLCKGMGLEDGKTLIVTSEKSEALTRSSRNLFRYLVLPCEGLNVYDLLRFDRLVILRDAVGAIHERLG